MLSKMRSVWIQRLHGAPVGYDEAVPLTRSEDTRVASVRAANGGTRETLQENEVTILLVRFHRTRPAITWIDERN
jgi:hypothetical protein